MALKGEISIPIFYSQRDSGGRKELFQLTTEEQMRFKALQEGYPGYTAVLDAKQDRKRASLVVTDGSFQKLLTNIPNEFNGTVIAIINAMNSSPTGLFGIEWVSVVASLNGGNLSRMAPSNALTRINNTLEEQ